MNPQSPVSDLAGRPLAAWPTRHPWLWAIALGIAGLVLTAVGIGLGQARGLDPVAATWVQAGFVAASALVGLAIMARTRPSLAEYGFRGPVGLARVAWLVPLAVIPVIVLATSGFVAGPAQALAYAATTVAVGFNEEIWYRGLQLAALRRLGGRTAVAGGSAVFAALHLTNVLAGRPPLYLALQFVFAGLVGLVLAELVAITGSLWVGIAWHFVYDFVAYCSGEALDTVALIGIAAMCAVLAGYAAWLWRLVPRGAGR